MLIQKIVKKSVAYGSQSNTTRFCRTNIFITKKKESGKDVERRADRESVLDSSKRISSDFCQF